MTMRVFVLAALVASVVAAAPLAAQPASQGGVLPRAEPGRPGAPSATRPTVPPRQGTESGQRRTQQARPRDGATPPRGPGASAATPGLSSVLDRPSVGAPRGASRVGDSFARSGPYVSQQQFDRFTRRRGPTDTGAAQGISIFGPAGGGGGGAPGQLPR